jgi:hypothetical protein
VRALEARHVAHVLVNQREEVEAIRNVLAAGPVFPKMAASCSTVIPSIPGAPFVKRIFIYKQ